MARLRVRIKLNPGGVGVRMDKLAKISGETETFLRFLADDLGVSSSPGDWIANDFQNSSVGFLAELAKAVDENAFSQFNGGISYFTDFDPHTFRQNGTFKPRTYRQFVDIAKQLDADEVMGLGLFRVPDLDDVEWKDIRRQPALEIERLVLTAIEYIGAIQGRVGTWYKESDYFYLREIVTGSTVRCHYKREMYPLIYKLFEDLNAVVTVAGMVKSDRVERLPKEVAVTKVDVFPRLSEEQFDRFFGIAPDMTGEEAADRFIDRLRGDGD